MVLLEGDTMSRLFGLDLQLGADFFLSVIAIFVLFFAFSLLLFNPARKMLNNRKQRIKDEIKEAHEIKETADKLKSQYEEKLANIDSARKRALEGESRVVAEAREEAGRIIAHARTEAELEKQKAMDEVKREMIVIASMIAEKVVSEQIDTTVQDKLVEDTLKEIGKSTWQS